METKITTETIISWLKEQVETKSSISPNLYIDAAQKLNVLLSDEDIKLFDCQQKVAQLKVGYINQGYSVAKAKVIVEASDDYKEYCLQKAKIERIVEFIRIAKLQGRMQQEEYKGY